MIKKCDFKLIIIFVFAYTLALHYFVSINEIDFLTFEESLEILFMNLDIYNRFKMVRYDVTLFSTFALCFIATIKHISEIINDANGYHLLCLHRYQGFKSYNKFMFKNFINKFFINFIIIISTQICIYILLSNLIDYNICIDNPMNILCYFIKFFIINITCYKIIMLGYLYKMNYINYVFISIILIIILLFEVINKINFLTFGGAKTDLITACLILIVLLFIKCLENNLNKRKDIV